MDNLYVLNENFQQVEVIDEYISTIWTERYSRSGDVSIVTEPTLAMRSLLREGTLLQIDESDEVMTIENALLEDGVLKATGPSLVDFFKHRIFRAARDQDLRTWSWAGKPHKLMNDFVRFICEPGSSHYLIGAQVIPQLFVEPQYDNSGASVSLMVPYGTLFDALTFVADTYQVGFYLRLATAWDAGFQVNFNAYYGLDRTSGQNIRPIVRFSPKLDSLDDVTDLRSVAGYKNVAYAYAPNVPGFHPTNLNAANEPGIAYAPGAESLTGFKRRVLMVMADEITADQVGGSSSTLSALLTQKARDALANNNYVRIVDGEVSPNGEFKFGEHYGMGDVVELDNDTGVLQRARITEFIRVKDKEGSRAYPTVSVID